MNVNEKKIVQLGFLVKDARKTAAAFETMFDIRPATVKIIGAVDKDGKTKADYLGKPCYGKNLQIIFNFDNIQIELIEPLGEEDSIWKDCLEKDGEGIHHIAFVTDDIKASIKKAETLGGKYVQYGTWDDKPHDGQYAYIDCRSTLGTIIEFLEPPFSKGKNAF